MKIVAMIPIKLNNERIPNKNLSCFSDGTPLISFIQKTLLNVNLIDEIYVYCSDDKVQEYLLPTIHYLKRPTFLDTNSINCNDIIKEFMKNIYADIYVVSHATGPFTKNESITACIEAVKSNNYDSAFLAKEIKEFLWSNGTALNFDIQNFPRTQDLEPIYSEASGAYVFSRKTFETFGRRVGIKPYIHKVSEIESRDIDYLEDFKIADAIYTHLIKNI